MRAIDLDPSAGGLHQGAQQSCCNFDAVYMAATDQPSKPDQALALRESSVHGRSDDGECHQRLLGGASGFEETREVRAFPQLRDRQIDPARPCVPIALAVAVAVGLAQGAARALRRAGQRLHLGLHDALRGERQHQECTRSASAAFSTSSSRAILSSVIVVSGSGSRSRNPNLCLRPAMATRDAGGSARGPLLHHGVRNDHHARHRGPPSTSARTLRRRASLLTGKRSRRAMPYPGRPPRAMSRPRDRLLQPVRPARIWPRGHALPALGKDSLRALIACAFGSGARKPSP